MSYGILFLRVVIGLIFFAHGAQKLLGWYGGPGLGGIAGWLRSMGFRMPGVMALMVALSETSGILFALGLLTPFAALAVASVMVVAVGSVHFKNGFFAGNGGYEYNLLIWASAIAIAAAGPGRFSIDGALGWVDNLAGVWWGVGVLVVSIVGALLVLALRRTQHVPEDTDAPLAREREDERVTAS